MAFYTTLNGQSHEVNDAKNSEGLNTELNIRSRIVSASFHSSGCWPKSLLEKQMKLGAGQAQIDGWCCSDWEVFCVACVQRITVTLIPNSRFIRATHSSNILPGCKAVHLQEVKWHSHELFVNIFEVYILQEISIFQNIFAVYIYFL